MSTVFRRIAGWTLVALVVLAFAVTTSRGSSTHHGTPPNGATATAPTAPPSTVQAIGTACVQRPSDLDRLGLAGDSDPADVVEIDMTQRVPQLWLTHDGHQLVVGADHLADCDPARARCTDAGGTTMTESGTGLPIRVPGRAPLQVLLTRTGDRPLLVERDGDYGDVPTADTRVCGTN